MTNYFYKETVNIPYEKTVIEKRAPTDDSIRLFGEIQDKAYKSILGTINVQNNLLNVAAILYIDPFTRNAICEYRLLLNNKEINGKLTIEEPYLKLYSYEYKMTIFKAIVEDASKDIAVEIIKSFEEQDILWL